MNRLSVIQLLFGMAIVGDSIFEIFRYKKSGCISLMAVGMVCQPQAQFYYYVMWALVVVGVILIATSFKRKNSNGDERK